MFYGELTFYCNSSPNFAPLILKYFGQKDFILESRGILPPPANPTRRILPFSYQTIIAQTEVQTISTLRFAQKFSHKRRISLHRPPTRRTPSSTSLYNRPFNYPPWEILETLDISSAIVPTPHFHRSTYT